MCKKSASFLTALLAVLLIFPISSSVAAESVPNFKVLIDQASKLTALPKKLSPSLLQVPNSRKAWFNNDCTTDFASTDLFQCTGGNPASKKIIVLYGDSHASMWMTAIDSIAKKKNYKVIMLAKLACPIVQKTIWSYQLNKPFTECDQWNVKATDLISKLNPDYLIVTNQWKPAVQDGNKDDFGTNGMWSTEFPKALSNLKSIAKKVIVIGNNPSMTTDPLRCASKPKQNLLLCASVTPSADNHLFNQIERDSAKTLGIPYIDTVSIACSQLICPIIINGYFVYFDQWHFTDPFVQFVTPWLSKKLNLV